jgi:hypothetical protein
MKIPDDKMKSDEMINDEDYEVWKTREWIGSLMKGRWDGKGSWHLDDGTWVGRGTWKGEGGQLFGNWEGKGAWKPTGKTVLGNDYGDWQCDGIIESTVSFSPYMGIMVFVTGASVTAAFSMISYFVAQFGDIISISIGLIIFTFTLILFWFTRSSNEGVWSATGTWEDIGEYRILDLNGKIKLGYHDAVLRGKMKDPKPK